MQKLNLQWPLIILFLFVASCASVPDVPICAEINLSKGICTYTVSGKNVEVSDEKPLNGETWFDMRAKVLSVPASSWAELKAWMIKQCKKNKCSVDISSWDRDLNQ